MRAVDMHCDTILQILADPTKQLRENDLQIDLQRMKASGTTLQNFALFVELVEGKDPYETAMALYKIYQEQMSANSDLIRPVLTYQDYLDNQAAGFLSGMLTMEEGAPLAGRIDRLEEFYDKGVRMLTLTWNHQNEIGTPNLQYFDEEKQLIDPNQTGLTPAGIAIVKKMNELGMIIDVSHGSDQLVRDVLANTDKPFVASHSDAREVCFHSRNLPDELIKAIADRGGVIGINYAEDFLRGKNKQLTMIDAIVAHVRHFVKIGGIECVGLGSDFDGIPRNRELDDILVIHDIQRALKADGFSEAEIAKIFHGNVEALYKELLV